MKTAYFICDFETTGLDPSRDYPIEVGLVICSETFALLDTYSSLILWPAFTELTDWPSEWREAATVHRISLSDLKECSRPVEMVRRDIAALVSRFRAETAILVSDNIQFDYALMRRLMGPEFPFHYHGYDTQLVKILLSMVGIRAPNPTKKQHRALADALHLYIQIRQVMVALELATAPEIKAVNMGPCNAISRERKKLRR
ncbi:hypothetical protein DRO38_07710 [Candidatus Bathyarchaeota archaeon]|nr:MAG: hypothetical protein DRO38_07710 [Candidatus Bathyarchaeota archaeon]